MNFSTLVASFLLLISCTILAVNGLDHDYSVVLRELEKRGVHEEEVMPFLESWEEGENELVDQNDRLLLGNLNKCERLFNITRPGFGKLDCECVREESALEWELKCFPVSGFCGPKGKNCAKVSIAGILDLFGWGALLSIQFCFDGIVLRGNEIILEQPLCIGYGPNLLALLFTAIGVPAPVVAVITFILNILTRGGRELNEARISSFRRQRDPFAGQPNNGNSCTATLGEEQSCKCDLCDEGRGVVVDCSEFNEDLVSTKCTSVLDELNAGVLPSFG